MLPRRIHIFGASGSGTTTLAAAVAAKHGHRHLATDDFFWLPTDPPYREIRPREARLALLRRALAESPSWVLSGSLCGWGDPLIPEFDLVVFLLVPTEIRLARLRDREIQRYGRDAVAPGGSLHHAHTEFLDWAGRYDAGGLDMRSRALHEAWLSALPGATLRLEGEQSVGEQLAAIEAAVGSRRSEMMSHIRELHGAVRRGDTALMKALLDENPGLANSLSATDPRGTYPLHVAAEFGQADAARILLDYGADVSVRDAENDAIALGWAAFFGRPRVVAILLGAGSAPSQRNKHGLTPLACAIGGTQGRWKQFSDARVTDWQEAADTIRAHGGTE